MKCMKKGDEIRRVKDELVFNLLKKGYDFCSKLAWKKSKGYVPYSEQEEPPKAEKTKKKGKKSKKDAVKNTENTETSEVSLGTIVSPMAYKIPPKKNGIDSPPVEVKTSENPIMIGEGVDVPNTPIAKPKKAHKAPKEAKEAKPKAKKEPKVAKAPKE